MRLAWLLVIAGCAASSVGARRSNGPEVWPSDRAAIQGVLDGQAAAWNRGDLAGYMAGYAKIDDLVFTSGAKVRTGWQTTFDHFQKRYGQDLKAMGKLVFEVTRIDAVGADGAVALGTWILTESPADGRGVFSVVLERRPEGWRIVHDHTSSASE
ncbi:MAG TPA: nuclear transport factor 2 family protein [Kofleriaceae bacterium]